MTALLALHALVGCAIVAGGARLGRRALLIGAVAPTAALVWLLASLGAVVDGHPVIEEVAWVPSLDLTLSLRLDGFGALMALLVTGIGVLVFATPTATSAPVVRTLVAWPGSWSASPAPCSAWSSPTTPVTRSADRAIAGGGYADQEVLDQAAPEDLGGSAVLFITALALLYAATGTVNMADLTVKMADLPSSLQSAFAVLLLVVFGIKAAIFPLFFWLRDSYPTAPSPVTAVFAGLLTKVGVYAVIRTQTLLFPDGSQPATLLVWVAGLTMGVGVLGAIAQDDVKRILSFNIVSHIGYMIMGLSLFTVAGLAAAVY